MEMSVFCVLSNQGDGVGLFDQTITGVPLHDPPELHHGSIGKRTISLSGRECSNEGRSPEIIKDGYIYFIFKSICSIELKVGVCWESICFESRGSNRVSQFKLIECGIESCARVIKRNGNIIVNPLKQEIHRWILLMSC
jgi:hypothetical protein